MLPIFAVMPPYVYGPSDRLPCCSSLAIAASCSWAADEHNPAWMRQPAADRQKTLHPYVTPPPWGGAYDAGGALVGIATLRRPARLRVVTSCP